MNQPHPGRWWHALDDGRIQCDLCPRDCKLQEGQRGFCFVRQREGDQMVLTTWGRSSGFVVDPIEKKPLNHFHPGAAVLSFGTAGCNLGCRFCQNWDISKARDFDRLQDEAKPGAIAARAAAIGCRAVAFTYNDPVIFAEYAMDVADACREAGVATVAVTAGYIHDAPRRAFFDKMDAANVDLKAFTEDFYRRITFAHLGPVLETLRYLRHESRTWLEITTLLIPGHNDSERELRQLCEWVVENLGTSVPVHFSGFHPDFKMKQVPPTPAATLRRAREIAKESGIRHAYTGNIHDREGDTTRCTGCDAELIVRDWYDILHYRLKPDGTCPDCGQELSGRFGSDPGNFGRRRMRVSIA